ARHGEARAGEGGDPFRGAVVPRVRRIPQQRDRLQVGIECAVGGGDRVDEHRAAGVPQHPPRLAQAGLHVLPVMRREPAQHDIEGRIGKRQPLRRRLTDADIGEAALGGGGGDGLQHLGGHVAGDDLRDMRRRAVADMAAATAEVQHARRVAAAQLGLDLIEVSARTVDHARHVVPGARAVLLGGELVLCRAHDRPSWCGAIIPRSWNRYKAADYPGIRNPTITGRVPSGSARPLEELLHLGEEALAFRVALVVGHRFRLELLHELALPAGEVLRRLDGDLDVEIAARRAAQHGKALPAQAELVAGLGARRNFHPRLAAVDRRHLDLAAEGGLRHAQRHAHQQVGAVALEDGVRADADMHVEITGRRALATRLALAGEPDARAVLHPGRDCDLQRALALHRAGAVADAAGVADDAAGAAAGRAGAFDEEEALLGPHLAGAAAGRTGIGRRLRLVLGAGAGAGLARDARRHAQADLGAGEGLREVDLHGLPQIGAGARAAAAAPPVAHEVAEHLVEDVAETARAAAREVEPAGEAARAAAAAILERGVAEAIVGRALLLVLEHLVGLAVLLEAR